MKLKDSNKVDVIFESSLSLIYKEGIAGLTMAKIAKSANIATGTLYVYFESKEQLLNELYKYLRNKSLNRFLSGYDKEKPFKIRLKIVWINYLKHRIEYYEESVFMEQYYRSPYITDNQKKIAESLKTPIHELLQRGKKEMLIKQNTDIEMLFIAMLGFIRELVNEHVAGIYILNEERIEKAFQLSWDMIKE